MDDLEMNVTETAVGEVCNVKKAATVVLPALAVVGCVILVARWLKNRGEKKVVVGQKEEPAPEPEQE